MGIALAWLASLAGLALIIVQTAPKTTSTAIKTLFFLALFVNLWSLATLIEYGIRRRSRPGGIWAEAVLTSSCIHSFFVAFLLVGALLIRKIL